MYYVIDFGRCKICWFFQQYLLYNFEFLSAVIGLKKGKLLLQESTKDTDSGMSFHDLKFPTMNGQPKELFFSSDANALVEHTKRVLVIEDDEVVHLKVLSLFCL